MPDFSRMKNAAEAGDIAELKKLVDQGANVNTPVNDHTPIVWAAARNKPEAVRWLLEHGAEPDRRGDGGWTALMSAVTGPYTDIARMLLDAGANPLLADKQGRNAISLARDKGNKALLAMLTETPDEVVFTDRVYDRVVQEVYSFKRKERFTFVRKDELGDIEAVQRESFSDLANTPGLRAAFEQHHKRGGKMTEEEVFDTPLQKTRVLPRLGPNP